MKNCIIKAATIDDVEVIYRFMCELQEKELDIDDVTKCLQANLDKEYHHHLLAMVDNKIVAFISCYGQMILHKCGMVYEVQELFVDAAYRSMHIGRQLLSAIEERIGEHASLKLCSNMRRKDAHRFYLNNGFEQTGYRFVKS